MIFSLYKAHHIPSGSIIITKENLVSVTARKPRIAMEAATATTQCLKEVRPPVLDSSSDPPAVFDGTTRLYISYICPYAQRTWITRNYKGLQEKIKLMPLDLGNRPAWYKEKVYPANKVPCLEHNNEVKGESMDLVRFIDSQFDGPALLPDDEEKRQYAEEVMSYTDSFNKINFTAFTSKGDTEIEVGASFDRFEEFLSKYEDGPFFLGKFSMVDVVFVPFVERFQLFFADVKNYNITKGRPKLSLWIEEISKLAAYTDTCLPRHELLAVLKQKYGIN